MAPATAQPPKIQTTRWRLDPDRSSVEFRVKHLWGMSIVEGSFSRYRGTLDLGGRPAIELTIEAASLDTNNERRDRHLRSADFFDVENHPQIGFVSESAALDGERLEVHGQLRTRGATVPLSLSATLRAVGDELEIEATTETDHRRLGMTWNALGMVRAPSRLTVVGRLVRDDN
jgi:polyisoprenoid-binding protein YceI